MYINQNFRNSNLEQTLLAGEESLQRQYQLAAVRSSKFSRVYKFTARFNGIDRAIYFKQYLYRSGWDFVKHLFRAGRAKRAFKASLMLAENGFNTPCIIAMGESKSSFFHSENFLVTLGVEGAKPLFQLFHYSLKDLTTEQLRDKRKLIRAFGRTIGRMHAKGIFHGDLRLGNVLAKPTEAGWQFYFIDNERTKKFYKLPNHLRLKNLVQVNMFQVSISHTDRLRFFKAYLEKNPHVRANWKYWAKKTLIKTSWRLRKRMSSCKSFLI